MKCQNCGGEKSKDGLTCDYCGSQLVPDICSHCFTHCPKGSKFCHNCGILVIPPKHKVTTPKKCPTCQVELEANQYNQATIETCPSCQGQWISTEDWNTILRVAAENHKNEGTPKKHNLDEKPYIKCPVCSELMYRGIIKPGFPIIDKCNEHGYWLDAGELESVIIAAPLKTQEEINPNKPFGVEEPRINETIEEIMRLEEIVRDIFY